MSLPKPQPGHVIRYAYLWSHEHDQGLEEGLKDRPAAIVLTLVDDAGTTRVAVAPITHTPPVHPHDAVEIPAPIKRSIGLDDERSWVVVTEINVFAWPGPDLRPTERGGEPDILYGALPSGFFRLVRDRLVGNIRLRKVRQVPRTE